MSEKSKLEVDAVLQSEPYLASLIQKEGDKEKPVAAETSAGVDLLAGAEDILEHLLECPDAVDLLSDPEKKKVAQLVEAFEKKLGEAEEEKVVAPAVGKEEDDEDEDEDVPDEEERRFRHRPGRRGRPVDEDEDKEEKMVQVCPEHGRFEGELCPVKEHKEEAAVSDPKKLTPEYRREGSDGQYKLVTREEAKMAREEACVLCLRGVKHTHGSKKSRYTIKAHRIDEGVSAQATVSFSPPVTEEDLERVMDAHSFSVNRVRYSEKEGEGGLIIGAIVDTEGDFGTLSGVERELDEALADLEEDEEKQEKAGPKLKPEFIRRANEVYAEMRRDGYSHEEAVEEAVEQSVGWSGTFEAEGAKDLLYEHFRTKKEENGDVCDVCGASEPDPHKAGCRVGRAGKFPEGDPDEKEEKKPTTEAREWISRKIKYLIEHEGKTPEQAAGQAYSMARQRGYKVPEKEEEERGNLNKEEMPKWKYGGMQPHDHQWESHTPSGTSGFEMCSVCGKIKAEKSKLTDAKKPLVNYTVTPKDTGELNPDSQVRSKSMKWFKLEQPTVKNALAEFTDEYDVAKAYIHFYDKDPVSKSLAHYRTRVEAGEDVLFDQTFDTFAAAEGALTKIEKSAIEKYYALQETNKPITSLHVLYQAYKAQLDAAQTEQRKEQIQRKLDRIQRALAGNVEQYPEQRKDEKKKSLADEVGSTKWEDIHSIVKMRTHMAEPVRLIEEGIYNKDGSLTNLETLDEVEGQYYTKDGKKIDSDIIKAIRHLYQTGIYSTVWSKLRKPYIV